MSELDDDMQNKTNIMVQGFYDENKKEEVIKMWQTLMLKGLDTKKCVDKLYWFIKLL